MSNYILNDGVLYHHGVKGQKWGNRRWQYEDGSLTPAGREHYGYVGVIKNKNIYKKALKGAKETYKYNKNFIDNENSLSKDDKKAFKKYEKRIYKEGKKEIKDSYKRTEDYKKEEKIKKAAIVGAAIVGTALVTYGGYKLYKNNKLNEEMKDINYRIKEGKVFTEHLANTKLIGGENPEMRSTVTYLGNDLKYHTAVRERGNGKDFIESYKNIGADTQQQFKSLKEYKQAKKALENGGKLVKKNIDFTKTTSNITKKINYNSSNFEKYNDMLYKIESKLKKDPSNNELRKQYNEISKKILKGG